MSLHIQDPTSRFMAAASVGITAMLLGVRLSLIELQAAARRRDEEWLRIRASESQSYWTSMTFRAVRACAKMPVDWNIEDDDARRLMESPALVISNHQDALDIPTIAWFLRIWDQNDIRWVVKKEIRKWPFIGRSCEKAGCAFISRDRRNMREDLNAVSASAKAAYDERANFILFAEGTRFNGPDPESAYKHVLPPKRGMVRKLLEIMPDYPICSLTLCQHPRGVPSDRQTLFIRARVVDADVVRADVKAWLKAEWDAKEAFIASLNS